MIKGSKLTKEHKEKISIWLGRKRPDWTCQKCGQRGGELNADHI